ncbi:hypothetical protein GCM10007981_04310 [Thermocladium modestius]|uniref:Protein kinase domain-containing protein n=1 Tax=Thermocladium modestius TaxID=62609 RepID=A0A830GSF3_9CREN|nr:protein kinase [Thermocladium modestius]GGP19674.1 hypothetical protein GCM10007981_04310 [Thermocladium modestius]
MHSQLSELRIIIRLSYPCEVVPAFHNLIDALEYTYSRGVVHCDIKPGNVLVKRGADGVLVVKLSDWNASRIFQSSHPTLLSRPALTPTYAAPEQFDGRVGEQTDVYQLYESMYEVLIGTPSFTSISSKFRGEFKPPSVHDKSLAALDQ